MNHVADNVLVIKIQAAALTEESFIGNAFPTGKDLRNLLSVCAEIFNEIYSKGFFEQVPTDFHLYVIIQQKYASRNS